MSCFFNFNEFSLAQERQENVQKIVLEGTERMEDQVRCRLCAVNHHGAHGLCKASACIRLRANLFRAFKPCHFDRVSLRMNKAFMEMCGINWMKISAT